MNLYMNAQNISFEPITIRIIYNLEANMWINNTILQEKRIQILRLNEKDVSSLLGNVHQLII